MMLSVDSAATVYLHICNAKKCRHEDHLLVATRVTFTARDMASPSALKHASTPFWSVKTCIDDTASFKLYLYFCVRPVYIFLFFFPLLVMLKMPGYHVYTVQNTRSNEEPKPHHVYRKPSDLAIKTTCMLRLLARWNARRKAN